MIISAPYGWRNAAIRFTRNAPAQVNITRARVKQGSFEPRALVSQGNGRFTFGVTDLPPGNYEIDVMPEPDDFRLEGDGNPR